MGNIFHIVKFNRIFLCSTLAAISLTTTPTNCYSQINIGTNDIAFAYRIEQLLEKVKKAADKNDGNKLIDLMLDVKKEVEAYSVYGAGIAAEACYSTYDENKYKKN